MAKLVSSTWRQASLSSVWNQIWSQVRSGLIEFLLILLLSSLSNKKLFELRNWIFFEVLNNIYIGEIKFKHVTPAVSLYQVKMKSEET